MAAEVTIPTEDTMESNNRSLYNNGTLSDVTVNFSDQHVFAHKAILAHRSVYFLTAFTGHFSVATSKEIDLGNDDGVEAVHAMIRHIYDLPYAQDVTASYTFKEDLIYCMNVFIVADKYDIPSLRKKVVPDFLELLQRTWKTTEFAECVQKLCGPGAIQLADPALQAAISEFFTNNMSKITYHDSLVEMINEDRSFTGRILAGLLKPTSGSTRYLGVCHKPNSSNRTPPDCTHMFEENSGYLAALNKSCVHCGVGAGGVYNVSGDGGRTAKTEIARRVKVVLM